MTTTNTASIEAALSYIPANDREIWLKIGNALKTELGTDGFVLFNDWSTSAPNYKASDTKAVWQSLQIGKNKLGTVFYYAQQHGFKYDKNIKPQTLDPQQRAERQQQQQAAIEQAAQDKALRYAQIATKAQAIWQDCHYIDNNHPYLQKKAIQAYGLRCYNGDLVISGMACQDCLVIPASDNTGNIHTLQFISPTGEKRFLANGNKQAHYHLIKGNNEQVLVCEGYATGASLHQATGYSVAVAFDASNLLPVSLALQAAYPNVPLVICADNDHEKPKNTGLEAANKAALSVNALVAYPMFTGTGEGLKDFNDLAQVEGLETVKTTITQAQPPKNEKAALPTTESTAPIQHSQTIITEAANETQPLKEPSITQIKTTRKNLPRFELIEKNSQKVDGVYYFGVDKEGEPTPPLWICGALHREAKTRNEYGDDWGILLRWHNADGQAKTWAMPCELLAGSGEDYRRYLLSGGLEIAPSQRAKQLLTSYLQDSDITSRARCVNKTGWADKVYVLPHRTIGAQHSEPVIYQASERLDPYHINGTLADWQHHVSSLCVGNSRLALAVSMAFAAPLLRLMGTEGGGIHLMGGSSTGKSTAQVLACSVMGNPEHYKKSWRATGNGLEGTATAHNDGLLVLDEIGEVQGKELGEIAYMLGNGQGKQRANRHGAARPQMTWLILFLSSGEVDLTRHMAESGKIARTGQEMRLLSVEADSGKGYGLFEHLHQDTPNDTAHAKDAAARFASRITEAAKRYYGSAFVAYLEQLTTKHIDNEFLPSLKAQEKDFMQSHVPMGADGQVQRAAKRFAIIGIAGELATQWGITKWPKGEALQAAATCFKTWLERRGGTESQEVSNLLAQVSAFFESHGEARFSDMDDHSDTPRIVFNRVGFRQTVPTGDSHTRTEYFVLKEAFKEVTKGFDTKWAATVLREVKWLKTDKDRSTFKKYLPELGYNSTYYFLKTQ